ncbi:hypothetical protein [Planktotalea arctica]|uniref:hypothetical protein n=1 Tax=Planktotalea arctica TaxID=1481893 RepID=UPI00321B554D
MDQAEREDIVDNALAAQYPKIWAWEPTVVETPYGPDDMNVVNTFATRVAKMRSDSKDALLHLPDDELLRMRDHKKSSASGATWPWADLLPTNPNDLLPKIPKIWAYGFGHPSFAPDFNYWAMMPTLSVLEATLLSVGAKPDLIPEKHVFEMRRRNLEIQWACLKFFIERYELMYRQFPSGVDRKLKMGTKRVSQWINETGLEVHPAFKAALDRRFNATPEQASPRDMVDVERVSLLKLVAGMAIEQYAYDPGAQRNEAIKNISDDLDRLGLSLDRKTIRKWLKEACEFIDPQNLPK